MIAPSTLLATLLALLPGCAKTPPVAPFPAGKDCAVGVACAYDGGLLPLASAFAAKEACSCHFVAGRSEDECRAWVRVSPAVATFRIDEDERRVVAHALGMAEVSARFVDAAHGCVLESADQR